MVVKIHQRIYSDEDPAAVDRAFELACSAFRQELDAYLAATPRKPRTKKSRRAKSITPTARRGGFKKTRNDISHDDEDDKSNTFQLSANNSPNTKKRRRLLFIKSDVEIHEPHLVSPIKEMEFGYLPLLIDEESSEGDNDDGEGEGDISSELNQAENHGSDASNDQENVVPLGMEIATTTTDSDLKKDLPRIIKDEKIPTFSNSSEVVKLLSNEYGPYFKFSNGFGSLMEFKQPQVDLIYPNEQTNESFILCGPVTRGRQAMDDRQAYAPVDDFVQTIEVFCRYVFRSRLARQIGGEVKSPLMELLAARATHDGDRFMTALKWYTELVQTSRTHGRIIRRRPQGGELPFELVCHITYQVYSRIVAPQVESLQNYKAFSNFVYGEINSPLMRDIIHEARISHDSVFIDLGCGIGNVVLHVAAQTGCEAYGVEIMKTPARLAQLQLREFEARMRGYGFPCGKIQMINGDFLELDQVAQILQRADVVMVNNYAFDAQLNQRLLQLFLDLKEGTRIVSLRNFVPLDHKITVRNAGSTESILSITSHTYPSGSVSWTNSGGQYFVQTVDRTAVQQFWKDMERQTSTN